MDQDKKLEQNFKDYLDVAKENPNIDVASLMLNDLNRHTQAAAPTKSRKWAYLISLGLPPLGLLVAAKYYMSDDEDGKNVAKICVLLTVISIILTVVMFKSILSSSGTSMQQIQQIKPQDIQQLY